MSGPPENQLPKPAHPLILFIQMMRPFFLLGGVLLYALGAGIARYLGTHIVWDIYLLGQIFVTTLQLSTHFLNEYYDSPADQQNPNRTPFNGGSGAVGAGKLPRQTALISGLVMLAAVASLSVLIMYRVHPTPVTYLIMLLAFFGAVFYSVPPVRLESSGYGELTTSLMTGFLLPAFAFSLQTGELHRLLAMVGFPLVALHFAMLIAFEMPDYGSDLKYGKRTILVRMGWKNGMTLHNILIISAYLLLILAASLGLPLAIVLPAFLPLPLGLLEIWQMHQIAQGRRPNWRALGINAVILFGATAYLLAFTFWTR